ncbi:hypothetical protein THRCLA_06298 [Thraustotheca clavata]|uniref:General transcription factor 3C polypeptide 5 n=1 Tax=Thraustotheca clavata TaxID=74557 RepID=A0A1V9ZPU9_9STRA|nr:hypothetical protein THRCLA_06298 [Thraustotheca clavata]
MDASNVQVLEIPSQEAVCVEMPLIFKDISKAPAYFGGVQNLVTTQETKTPFLPIKLRPNEPNCKPIFADRAKTQTFVLKVTKKRTNEPCKAAILAVTNEKFVCEGMADYQYLAAPKYFKAMNEPLPKRLQTYRNIEKAQELELVPEVFSRIDLPIKYEFKQRPQFKPKPAVEEVSIEPKSSGRGVMYINFHSDGEVPQYNSARPLPKTRGIPAELEQKVLTFLREKFEERPIWQRHKLFENISSTERRAALRFLPTMCYIFLNGPWRGMWVRMGYDPRKVQESAQYQMLEIRGNRELVHSTVSRTVKSHVKRSARFRYNNRLSTVVQSMDAEDDVALHFKQKKRHNRSKSTVKSTTSEPDEETPTYLIYGIPLSMGYFHIQLCDLRQNNKSADEFVKNFENKLREKPSVLTGWYPSCMFTPLREMLRYHIATVVGRSTEELAMREKQIKSLEQSMLNELATRGEADSDDNRSGKVSSGANTGDEEEESGDELDEATGDEAGTADEDDEDDDEEETKESR